MLDIPPIVYGTFFFELFGCTAYFIFNLFLSMSNQAFLRTPFFKLIHATGFAGIGVVSTYWIIHLFNYLPVRRESVMLIYVGQISNGSTTFCYTTGKFLILLNRLAVLHNIRFAKTGWTNKKTNILIFCQYTVPLVPHFYFAIAPVNWIGESYYGWDNTTGSSITSVTLYKQQRSLSLYTMASATCHMIFSTHQLLWSYSFLSGNSDLLSTVRYVRPFVQDFTTFVDPIVLIIVSKQVRIAIRKMTRLSILTKLIILISLMLGAYFIFIKRTAPSDSPLPQRAKRVLTAISGSEELSHEKRAIHPDSYYITPIRRASKDVDISIIIVVTEGTPLENYETALNSLQCYTKLHEYPLHLISDAKYNECAMHKDKFFRRHCCIARFMENEIKKDSWLLMLDADIAVINTNTLIEKYIDPDYGITLFDRFFNFEVVAGSYLVKNSHLGRAFVQGFADYEFKLPNSIHGSDNGALHPYLVDLLVPNNNRSLNSICANVWNESKSSADLYEMEACTRLIIGDRTHFPEHKLRIMPKGKAWIRDLWLLRGRWADDDFMLHAIKEKTLRKSRPQIENISDRQVFQWKPYEKIQRYFPLLRKLNVTKCELGEERWVYDSRLKISNDQKKKLFDYMEKKILKRRLETIGKLARRL